MPTSKIMADTKRFPIKQVVFRFVTRDNYGGGGDLGSSVREQSNGHAAPMLLGIALMDSSHETSRPHETTEILTQISRGDLEHMDRLIDVVYDELRRIATRHISRENPGHTLQPTALVHEAFIKLVNQRDVDWKGRAHFLAVAAESMRRILVDHARGRSREKRGGGRQRISLREELTVSNRNDEDVLAVDEALTKLAQIDPQQAKIVDLRFFAGMTISEIAEVLNVSKRTVERNWTMIKAWLRRELATEPE